MLRGHSLAAHLCCPQTPPTTLWQAAQKRHPIELQLDASTHAQIGKPSLSVPHFPQCSADYNNLWYYLAKDPRMPAGDRYYPTTGWYTLQSDHSSTYIPQNMNTYMRQYTDDADLMGNHLFYKSATAHFCPACQWVDETLRWVSHLCRSLRKFQSKSGAE